jgi:hypothetical protein
VAKTPVAPLPNNDRIARYVGYSKLRRDKDDNAIGVLHTAFELRPGDAYLSAAHLDHFAGADLQKLSSMKIAYDPHPLEIRQNGAFTVGQVGAIKESCEGFSRPVRIVNAPSKTLSCYVQVRQFKSDLLELLDALASDSWREFTLVKNIP